MITASYMTSTSQLRREWNDARGNYYNVSLGALDAPECISSGHHVRVPSISGGDYEYGLPGGVMRDR